MKEQTTQFICLLLWKGDEYGVVMWVHLLILTAEGQKEKRGILYFNQSVVVVFQVQWSYISFYKLSSGVSHYKLFSCEISGVLSQLLSNQIYKTEQNIFLWENQHPQINCNFQTTIKTLMWLCPFSQNKLGPWLGGSVKYRYCRASPQAWVIAEK